MPPEPLPLVKEKIELLGGGGLRWKEPPKQNHYGSSCSVPDFRSRGHPGHGNQGGWNLYPEESGHGLMPSRSNEKIVQDESCRPSGSCVDANCSKNSRDNRSFGHRELRGHSLEAASPSTPGRLNDTTNDQRDQQSKSDGVNGAASTCQKFERASSLGSIEWRPMKWIRSCSLSSRGSLSHSSSSKSMGVDSNEIKAELLPRNSTHVQSPFGDAAACVTFEAPSEEPTSSKKPRLGWGEGLAKYEKKKVEGPDDSETNVGTFISDNVEFGHSQPSNLADKSPRVASLLDCASPSTPSSVACSSSPGLEDKQFVKATTVDEDVGNLSGSLSAVSRGHSKGSVFDFENLDLAQISALNSSINEVLQSDDLDCGFMRSTALSKLLVWKSDISKALEKTESEIDFLENELKKSISAVEYCCLVPSESCSPLNECKSNTREYESATCNIDFRPAPLLLGSSEDMIGEKGPNAKENVHTELKVKGVSSPGSATLKFVEVSSGKFVAPVGRLLVSDDSESRKLEGKVSCFGEEKASNAFVGGESSQLSTSYCVSVSDGSLSCRDDALYNLIVAANKDSAKRASEVFNKLLPTSKCCFDFSKAVGVSSWKIDSATKERFVRRKQFLHFKEKILALKFRVLQHLWKKDIRMLSVRKFRAKSQKKIGLSLRPLHIGHQKHRSIIRSRFSLAVGNLSLISSSEMLGFATRLLSESQVKVYGNMLRMPALILDKKEKIMSRFISKNGLVEDPCTVEKERSMINSWTTEERDNFIDKLATFGKDFKKIASFLDHKTTADCIEFYYKNHKSDCFERTKRKPDYSKQGKPCSANTYMVTSGKRWNREANAVSLDILGAASVVAPNVEDVIEFQPRCKSKYFNAMTSGYQTSKHGELGRSNNLDVCHSERETVAADVLAGIGGSLLSEAMSSCTTSSVDRGEGYQVPKCQKVGSATRLPPTPEAIHNSDDESCSDESCGEMDRTDWTDKEKSILIQAVSAHGKDFDIISRCLRTRSSDQCKIFFGKVKKRLGLDTIRTVPDNLVNQDAHGGGSEAEDGCARKTVSLMCNEKSGIKLDMNSSDDKGVPQLDMNSSDDKDRAGEMVSVDTELMSKDCALKQDVELYRDSEVKNGACNGKMQADDYVVTYSREQHGQIVGDTTDNGLPERSSSDEVFTKQLGEELKGVGHLPIVGLKHRNVERDEVSGLNCSLENTNSEVERAGNNSHIAAVKSRGMDPITGSQNKTLLECVPAVNSLESNVLVLRKSIPHASNAGKLSNVDLEKVETKQCEDAFRTDEQPFLESSRLAHAVSSHILGSHSYGGLTIKERADSFCNRPGSLQDIQKLDPKFHSDKYSAVDSFLRKCNSSKSRGSIFDLPDRGQLGGGISSNIEKPCRSGDVKLFGQILTKPSSQQNPSSNTYHDQYSQHSRVGAKFERNNFIGTENHPAKSYGFWDGGKIQTGLSSLSDPATQLAKYPAACGHYAMSSSKMDQPPLPGVVKIHGNGVPVFPTRDISSSNGVAADYHMYRNRDLQPLAIDMKQQQDVLFSEMHRRNGFGMVSGVQQQATGALGINVAGRGGILVGGQCTGVSDPVAAIKLHYAKAEQFSGQANIVREDSSWR